MTQEEKAKRYNESLGKAREWYNDPHITIGLKGNLEDIFPELKESKDEKVKEQVIYAIGQLHVCECTKDKLRAWVEKQSQKETTYDEDMLGAIEYCKKNNRPLEKEHIAWLEKQGEYVRKDVFIKKAKLWLAEIHRVCDITDEHGYSIELRGLQARFENYMKGE